MRRLLNEVAVAANSPQRFLTKSREASCIREYLNKLIVECMKRLLN